jgi:undecaprenyl-diphosphatase
MIGGGRRRAVQAMLAAIAVGAVCVVAMTRVYLGVHWLSDVMAGALLGALAVSLAAAALRTRGDGRRPGIAPEMFPPNGLKSRRAAASRGPEHAATSTSSAMTDPLGSPPPPTEGADSK